MTNAQENTKNIICDLNEPGLSVVFFEKAVYEASNPNEKNIALLEKAYCYKLNNQFKEAAETLERTFPNLSNDSIKFLIGYESALCNYLDANYSKALLSLFQVKYSTKSKDLLKKLTYLEILLAHEQQNWKEANNLVNEMAFSDSTFNDSINLLYATLSEIKLKDPEKAETLSYFIPGAGQMYAGKVFRGITSFLIQTGLLGFAGYSFLNGYYFSGTFTGVSLFYVFYMGGARHAGYLAGEYNEQAISERKTQIEKYLFEQIKKEAIF